MESSVVKKSFESGQAVQGAVAKLSAYAELKQYSSDQIENAWGLACSFDIYNCNPKTIRDAEEVKRFVAELCDLIEMKRFGQCTVVNFGEDERVAGFSMTQLIETSLISAHFANASNTTYLDVFSCKPYDPAIVEQFALQFFGGTNCHTHISLRR